jgi:hypothetical protein
MQPKPITSRSSNSKCSLVGEVGFEASYVELIKEGTGEIHIFEYLSLLVVIKTRETWINNHMVKTTYNVCVSSLLVVNECEEQGFKRDISCSGRMGFRFSTAYLKLPILIVKKDFQFL